MVNKSGIRGTFLIALIILSTASLSYAAKKSEKITPERKIHMFMIAMDSGIIEKKALSELRKLTRSKDPAIKSRAIGLLAQYEGEGTGNLIKALTILIPYVIEKKEADSFKRKLIGGKDDKEFLNAIPPASKWKFKEGVGDMQFSLKRWQQCIGSYQFALKSLGWLKKVYKYEESKPDPIIQASAKRIQRKLNEARRKWDEERYGPAGGLYWVDAENNYWGDSKGPNDPAAFGIDGDYNTSPSGNYVNDWVDYKPFLKKNPN